MTSYNFRWADISKFLEARIPAFGENNQGVERRLVEQVQDDLGITLPNLYVDMVVELGKSAGETKPLGPFVDSNFLALVDLHPPKMYPANAYFKISQHVDISSEPEDLFLDLARCDEHDGALVTISQAGPFRTEHVYDLECQLSSHLARHAFLPTELLTRPERCQIFAYPDDAEEAQSLRASAVASLEAIAYVQALPATPTFSCFFGTDGAATVEIQDSEVLAICISGNDADVARAGAEEIIKAVPGSAIQGRR